MITQKYDKDICPTCGSHYSNFSCARLDWKNGECYCHEQNILWRDYLLAEIPKDYFSKDLSDYRFTQECKDKTFFKDLQKYIQFIDNIFDTGSHLYIHNELSSTGKTFFSISLLKEAYRKKRSILFVPFVKIYNESFNKDSKAYFKKINEKDFLVIDAVDKKLNKEFLTDLKMLNYFEEFLRGRSRPIIFTSNTSLASQECDTLILIKKILKHKIYELYIDTSNQYESFNYWENIKQKKVDKIR